MSLQIEAVADYDAAIAGANALPAGESKLFSYDYMDGTKEVHGFVIGSKSTGFPPVLTLTESQKFTDSNFDEVKVVNGKLAFYLAGTLVEESELLGFVDSVTEEALVNSDVRLTFKAGANDLSTTTIPLSAKVDKEVGKGLSTNDFTDLDKAEVDKVADKVDKINGKGLSTNDFTDADVAELAKVADKVDKVVGKGLSENDFTDGLKAKLDGLESPLSKGYYNDLTELQTAHPSPAPKSFGYVATTTAGEYKLYVFEGGSYVDKGVIGGSVTISQIKSLIDADADSHLMTTVQKDLLDNIPQDYQQKEIGKGLSTNDYTLTDKDKVNALPNVPINSPQGLAQLDSTGKVRSTQLPTNIQLKEAGKVLIDQTVLNDLLEIVKIKGVAGALSVDANGILSIDPSQTSQFTPEETAFIRKHLAVNTWRLERSIQDVEVSGTKKKETWWQADDWFSFRTDDEDTFIRYTAARHYPTTILCELSVKSNDVEHDRNRTRKYSRRLYNGGEISIAWFNVDNWDDWDIHKGDTATFTMELTAPDSGTKWKKTYILEMKDIGGRKIKYNLKSTGDSLTDPEKIVDNSEWK